ncbi:PAS domain-containing protein [Opitutus sp. ER46]|uniref:PAS domain-containing protein n=1 Tax=Opitutus sp. ER46 TaxID=2161864 RepID=UPI000D326D0A|nr:PAS domain-containing protein [Opitutus sp. ER46]PTY01263.1 hypothetical protein DB354_00090 [Opitutus sp. ER46]
MKVQSTPPTGQSQTFDVAETFFSTTDLRGLITAGNEVFCRTSGFPFEEMFGQPHNLVRSPAMPRAVFHQMWKTIRAGRLFMGYVKNQARNGNHYWVFAVIVPIARGYLSVRIKPTSPLLRTIEALYRRLQEGEAAALERGESEGNAAEVGVALLQAEVEKLGYATYDAFSHHALNTEIKSRDAEVASRRLRLFPEELGVTGEENSQAELGQLYALGLQVYQGLSGLFSSLDAFVEICRNIRIHQDEVQRISDEFRLNALNAHIAAHPLGAEGIALGTVAQALNGHGQTLSRHVGVFAERILRTTGAVNDVTSNLSAARIQVEMLLSFLAESAQQRHEGAERERWQTMIADLRAASTSTIGNAARAMGRVQVCVPEVLEAKEQLRKDILFIQVAQVSGMTEVSRLRDGESLHATFTGLRQQVEGGKGELEHLDRIVDELQVLALNTPPRVAAIEQALSGQEVGAAGAAEARAS